VELSVLAKVCGVLLGFGWLDAPLTCCVLCSSCCAGWCSSDDEQRAANGAVNGADGAVHLSEKGAAKAARQAAAMEKFKNQIRQLDDLVRHSAISPASRSSFPPPMGVRASLHHHHPQLAQSAPLCQATQRAVETMLLHIEGGAPGVLFTQLTMPAAAEVALRHIYRFTLLAAC